MGIFKLLFGGGSSNTKVTDRVWMEKPAKYIALCKHVTEARASHRVWVMAHFKQSLQEVKQAFDVANVKYIEIRRPTDLAACPPETVPVLTAETFNRHSGSWTGSPKPDLFLLTEHFPTYSVDQGLLQTLGQLGSETEICCYTDITEPILNHFSGGSDHLLEMFKNLGMDSQSPLEHPMLSRSLIVAQKRAEKKATGNLPADSQEEWLQKNL